MDPGLLGTGLLTAFAVREVLQSRVRSRRVAGLVSGDGDLTGLPFLVPPVLTPRAFLELLR